MAKYMLRQIVSQRVTPTEYQPDNGHPLQLLENCPLSQILCQSLSLQQKTIASNFINVTPLSSTTNTCTNIYIQQQDHHCDLRLPLHLLNDGHSKNTNEVLEQVHTGKALYGYTQRKMGNYDELSIFNYLMSIQPEKHPTLSPFYQACSVKILSYGWNGYQIVR